MGWILLIIVVIVAAVGLGYLMSDDDTNYFPE